MLTVSGLLWDLDIEYSRTAPKISIHPKIILIYLNSFSFRFSYILFFDAEGSGPDSPIYLQLDKKTTNEQATCRQKRES